VSSEKWIHIIGDDRIDSKLVEKEYY